MKKKTNIGNPIEQGRRDIGNIDSIKLLSSENLYILDAYCLKFLRSNVLLETSPNLVLDDHVFTLRTCQGSDSCRVERWNSGLQCALFDATTN